jgi:hypothetical protein
MGNAVPGRRAVLEKVQECIALTNANHDHVGAVGASMQELRTRHNAVADRVVAIERRSQALDADLTKTRADVRHHDIVHEHLSERIARFETMTFTERLVWLLTGRLVWGGVMN